MNLKSDKDGSVHRVIAGSVRAICGRGVVGNETWWIVDDELTCEACRAEPEATE